MPLPEPVTCAYYCEDFRRNRSSFLSPFPSATSLVLRPLTARAWEQQHIFFVLPERGSESSTTLRRLVLIKLPLIPLSILPPSTPPPPPPAYKGGTKWGAGFGRMGQKSEFNGSLCCEFRGSGGKRTATVWRGERCHCSPQSNKGRRSESDIGRYSGCEPYGEYAGFFLLLLLLSSLVYRLDGDSPH